MTATNKNLSIQKEEHADVSDRQKAKFTDVTTELYLRLKNGKLPPDLILDQLQNLVEGNADKMKIALGRLKLWGKPITLSNWQGFKPERLLNAKFIRPFGSSLNEENLYELFESEREVKLPTISLSPYRMEDAEGRILKEATEQRINASQNISLGHLYQVMDFFLDETMFPKEVFTKEPGGNFFYISDKNDCYWMFNLYFKENFWRYKIEKAFEGRYGTQSPEFANSWIWLSSNN